jgi:hypothetical protein
VRAILAFNLVDPQRELYMRVNRGRQREREREGERERERERAREREREREGYVVGERDDVVK